MPQEPPCPGAQVPIRSQGPDLGFSNSRRVDRTGNRQSGQFATRIHAILRIGDLVQLNSALAQPYITPKTIAVADLQHPCTELKE